MLAATSLGATSGYTCSIGGVCVGSTVAKQQLFLSLQREANRAAAFFSIPGRIAIDGKIGPQTVGLVRQVADRAAARGPIDSALDDVRIEQTPAQDAKDLAANAEAVTAALARNGQPTSGGPMASIADFVNNIVANGQMAPQTPALPPGSPPLAPPSTTLPTPIDPYPPPPPAAPPAGSASPPIVFSSPWASWQVAVGIGLGLAALGAILAVFLRPRSA